MGINHQISKNCFSASTFFPVLFFCISRLISFDEFVAFEAILCTPDAPYVLAFEIFDRKGQGYLDFGKSNTGSLMLYRSLSITPILEHRIYFIVI